MFCSTAPMPASSADCRLLATEGAVASNIAPSALSRILNSVFAEARVLYHFSNVSRATSGGEEIETTYSSDGISSGMVVLSKGISGWEYSRLLLIAEIGVTTEFAPYCTLRPQALL